MSDEYAPSMRLIRHVWGHGEADRNSAHQDVRKNFEAFDRALEAEIARRVAEAKAEAWDDRALVAETRLTAVRADMQLAQMTPDKAEAWDELRAITEQDRADAVENIAYAIHDLDSELAVIDVLGQHELQFDGARNLGYYRTFIECSCGVGWWYGVHNGDPAAIDRWAIHRAQAIRAASIETGEQK